MNGFGRWTAAAGLGLALAAGPAAAESFAAKDVRLRGVVAQVTVVPEARSDVAVEIAAAGALPRPTVAVEGGAVTIDGGLGDRVISCSWGLGGPAVRVRGVGEVRLEDAPRIVIRTPRTLALAVDNALTTRVGASAGGAVKASGCGQVEIAPAAGALAVELRGSGDVTIGDVDGSLAAQLRGSGDIEAGAAREAQVLVAGSGSVRLGALAGGLTAVLDGSGDIEAARVEGPMDLSLAGSGDIAVKAGKAARMRAQLRGSGDIRFPGEVGELAVELSGSGDVALGRVTGARAVAVRGSGDVTVARMD